MQKMLKGPGALLDAQGNLTDVGWARQPLLDSNLEKSHFYALRFMQWLRIKRWDYYALTTPTHFFSFTVSDVGYLGSIFAYVIEFASGHYHEETLTIPLARGVELPRNSSKGESRFADKRAELHFACEKGGRNVEVHWPGFGGAGLNADLHLALPSNHESMVIVIPIRGKRFYYNRKINCLPASGQVDYQGKTYQIDPATCLGNLDWGRGVWEYKSFWVWASASGFLPDRRTIGLNLGFGFGDTSAAGENAFILNGRVHKLEEVKFTYDSKNFMKPWHMTSVDGRLDLEFTPFFERVAKTDVKLLLSEVHQMFGRYSGRLVTDSGEKIEVENLVGFAEEHHARW
ncbi:DUF2804 domain-containing protein [bacterium]|nr:MAG: DUF2804 domain-containing protein [bacterium]